MRRLSFHPPGLSVARLWQQRLPVQKNQKGITVKKLLLFITLTLGLMMTVGVAFADNTYNLYYDGPEGQHSYGIYVYPYYVQINGGPQVNMLCDAANRDISPGDSYPVSMMTFADVNAGNVQSLLWGNQGLAQYVTGAYLYEEEVQAFANNNSDPKGYYNWAVWYLFDPVDTSGYLDANGISIVQGLIADAQAATAGKLPTDFAWASSVFIYTPTGGNGQEFYGAPTVPEPGTLMMFASGLIGLAGMLRKKLRN